MAHPRRTPVWGWALVAVAVAILAVPALAVERFPPPDFTETGHTLPPLVQPPPGAAWQDIIHAAALAVGLALAAWFALRLRSRMAIAWLSVASLLYFGFYLGGCVCPIGSIQNVTAALADPAYTVPVTVVLIFALPLVFALLVGRVFCSGVCPLGAIQDLVLLKPLRLPLWLQSALSCVPLVYLGLAVLYAATGSGFVICQWDPFVAFFRLDGSPGMFLWGGGLLVLSTFIGRPYCRFLCPYGALLGLCARVAAWRVSTTPDECVNCRLCENACPFGAIRAPTYEGGGPQP